MQSKYIGIGGVIVVIVGVLFYLNSTGEVAPTAEVTKVVETQKVTENTEVKPETKVESVPVINSNTNTKMTEQNIGGMIVVDEVVGTGATAIAGDTVTVQYVGSLTNGKVFDASRNHGDKGFSFALGAGQVIKGWDLGVAGMKVGGKRKLTIPSDMAYGNRAMGDAIPANSTLVFEVELLKVGK